MYAHVRDEATRGAAHAAECLLEFEARPLPHPGAALFRSYCFYAVGRRDADGHFVNRERLYDLTPEFKQEYDRRLEGMLLEVAADVYGV